MAYFLYTCTLRRGKLTNKTGWDLEEKLFAFDQFLFFVSNEELLSAIKCIIIEDGCPPFQCTWTDLLAGSNRALPISHLTSRSHKDVITPVACLQIHCGTWPGPPGPRVLSFVFHVLLLGSSAFPATQPDLPGAVRATYFCMSSDIDSNRLLPFPAFLQLKTSRAQVPASAKLEAAAGKSSCTHARL